MKLSLRLEAVKNFIPPGCVVADVGADRGELSYALLEDGVATRVIVSDISPGSMARARGLFAGDPLEGKVDFRVGDGLKVLEPTEASWVVIAGIGGITISEILKRGKSLLPSFKGIVIQAMGNTDVVRGILENLDYTIIGEALVLEDSFYYPILKAVPGRTKLSDGEKQWGPVLLKEKHPLLKEMIQEELHKKEHILNMLREKNQGKEKQEALKREIDNLNDVLVMLKNGGEICS